MAFKGNKFYILNLNNLVIYKIFFLVISFVSYRLPWTTFWIAVSMSLVARRGRVEEG